jgi:hypothetical protein
LNGIRKAMARAQEDNETQTQRQRRVLADKAEAERIIAGNTEKHKRLNEKFAMCKKALDQTGNAPVCVNRGGSASLGCAKTSRTQSCVPRVREGSETRRCS